VAHSRTTSIPPVLSERPHFKALLRISAPFTSSGSQDLPGLSAYNISKYLKALDLCTSRIDRRPSTDGVVFQSLYFVEASGDTAQDEGSSMDLWSASVDAAISRVNGIGGNISLLGMW